MHKAVANVPKGFDWDKPGETEKCDDYLKECVDKNLSPAIAPFTCAIGLAYWEDSCDNQTDLMQVCAQLINQLTGTPNRVPTRREMLFMFSVLKVYELLRRGVTLEHLEAYYEETTQNNN